jgi:serine protease Do
MDFFEGFSHTPKQTSLAGILLSALFGAVLGGALVAVLIIQYVLPQYLAPVADPLPKPQEPVALTDRDLPEHQNTAIVRAAEQVLPTVVGITNKAMVTDFFGRTALRERATGSGVIIDAGGYIVTNNHVIEGASELNVTLSNGDEHPATLVGADPNNDLAVIKIERNNLPVARLGDSDRLKAGETAIAIGNPLGLAFSQTVTVGVISAKERIMNINEHSFTFVQTDAAINDGNSGGALVNLRGEVIGINTAKIKITGVEGMGFAIPANTVKNITRDLILHGRIIRPWIGVFWGGDVSRETARELQLPGNIDYGVIIQDVVREGPAHLAGIRQGDIIVAMDGKKTATFSDLRREIFKRNVGDEIRVTFYRGGQETTVTVKLAELP